MASPASRVPVASRASTAFASSGRPSRPSRIFGDVVGARGQRRALRNSGSVRNSGGVYGRRSVGNNRSDRNGRKVRIGGRNRTGGRSRRVIQIALAIGGNSRNCGVPRNRETTRNCGIPRNRGVPRAGRGTAR